MITWVIYRKRTFFPLKNEIDMNFPVCLSLKIFLGTVGGFDFFFAVPNYRHVESG
jgi:hypothetical protein